MHPARPVPLRQLRADDLVEVLAAAATSMAAHAPGLDRLDSLDGEPGDTGGNLVATMASVAEALVPGSTLTELADDLQRHDLGVGRSGGLLAAFLSGFAELCRNADALDPMRLAMAFEAGADAVLEHCVDPRPGALPFVASEVAEVALRCADEAMPLAEMMIEVADRGLDALERTPLEWPELADAGVVDAGGAGLLVVIDAFVAVIHGDDPELPEWEFPEDADDDGEAFADERFRYTVSLRLAPADDRTASVLARAWTSLGDGVGIEQGEGAVEATVNTDDIGAVIEAALGVGRPSGIVVRDRRG
ncbi:MAG: DAK2 domain-containing protein [Acidimicrobiales bacterium]